MASKYDDRIASTKQLWDRYITNKEPMLQCPEEMSEIIWSSWMRSIQYGVDPFDSTGVPIDEDRFRAALARDKDLLDAASSKIEVLYRNMVGSEYVFQIRPCSI